MRGSDDDLKAESARSTRVIADGYLNYTRMSFPLHAQFCLPAASLRRRITPVIIIRSSRSKYSRPSSLKRRRLRNISNPAGRCLLSMPNQ